MYHRDQRAKRLSDWRSYSIRVSSNLLWTWSKEDKSNKDLLGRYAAISVLSFLELGLIISARSLSKAISNYSKLLNSETSSEFGPGSLPNGNIPPNHNGPTIAIQESLATLAEMNFGIRFVTQQQDGNIPSDLMGVGGGGPGGGSSLSPSSHTNESIKPSISAPTLDKIIVVVIT
ncbi:hypothetical protein Pst134EB_018015 [Puccinia striiformis f. sp. tritici]|nr:hypothetical protein Pst134EB_018015 [Puccinia striiformis f. sp. tritici]